jgi:hypothetical protein
MNKQVNAVLDAVAGRIEHEMLCNVYVHGEMKAAGVPVDVLRGALVNDLAKKLKKPSTVANIVVGILEKQGVYNYGSLRVVAINHPKFHAPVRKVA